MFEISKGWKFEILEGHIVRELDERLSGGSDIQELKFQRVGCSRARFLG